MLGQRTPDDSHQNWLKCQEYELTFQTQNPIYAMKTSEITPEKIDSWTIKLEADLANHLHIRLSAFEEKDIIEVGCGSRGAINLISSPGRRVGIDPFIEEFRAHGCLLELDHVELFTQLAEALEFPSESFDFAICFNALDHVRDPGKALEQIHRVLKPSATLLLNVHTFELYSTRLFPWLLRKTDPTHPHHFSCKGILRILSDNGFKVTVADLQPLGLEYRNFFFRSLANLIGRTLWVRANRETKSKLE